MFHSGKRYHGVVLDFLRKKYPKSTFPLVNAGIGATDSVYGAFRAERDLLQHKPDLVILEFAVNDKDESLWAASYEGTVRQILAQGCPLIRISCLGIQGPAGRVSVRIDNNAPVMVESYFPHNWNDPKQLWIPVVSGLENGIHDAAVTLLEEHHPDGGTEFFFCAAAGTKVLHKQT